MTFVFKAAVVGAGTTGAEIVHAIAGAGIPVALSDPDADLLDEALEHARELWQRLVGAGKLPADQLEARLALIQRSTGFDGFGDVDFAIEAVPGRLDRKEAVFAELDAVTPGHAVLATASPLPVVTELGDVTSRPDRVVGFHLQRPVATGRLVEVVEGEYTSAETVGAAVRFAQAIRRAPIVCGEAPGFVINRIVAACAAEAWRAQHGSGATAEQVDRLLLDSGAATVGPFTLADRIGLDAILSVAELLREAYGDRFFIHPALPDLVERGRLGLATGRGFDEHA